MTPEDLAQGHAHFWETMARTVAEQQQALREAALADPYPELTEREARKADLAKVPDWAEPLAPPSPKLPLYKRGT